MEKHNVVIIGGGPAGIQTAISAKHSYPDKSITLIRKEKKAMIPCGIPYILHTLNSVDDDILPDTLLEKNKIKIICDEVQGCDANGIILSDLRCIGYEKLVLCTGSFPVLPKIPGIEKKGIFTVHKDYDRLRALKSVATDAKKVLIVGGGYIGIELADEFLNLDKQITLVELKEHLLPASMDPEFSEAIQNNLKHRGCEVITGISVDEFTGDGAVSGVCLENGQQLEADLVIVSVGYRPNTALAEMTGVEINPRYGVMVDEYMRTTDCNIFAAGDCAVTRNCYTGEFTNVMLASAAMVQGRLAGSNLYAIKMVKSFPGTLGTFATCVGGVAVGVTGLTEQQAKDMGVEYVVGLTETVDRHPGILPDSSKITLKLIYAKHCHTLLGAQIIGGTSIGELINMLSVMIQKKMTDMEIDGLQIGTHPLLTASPLGYPVINATVDAIMKWYPN